MDENDGADQASERDEPVPICWLATFEAAYRRVGYRPNLVGKSWLALKASRNCVARSDHRFADKSTLS
jgi:hypothetical protein